MHFKNYSTIKLKDKSNIFGQKGFKRTAHTALAQIFIMHTQTYVSKNIVSPN